MYHGWTDVHALLGGFDEWEAAGYPMEEKAVNKASGQAA
jgi:3-mercaptopyruvate sulfurtransferase SseA